MAKNNKNNKIKKNVQSNETELNKYAFHKTWWGKTFIVILIAAMIIIPIVFIIWQLATFF